MNVMNLFRPALIALLYCCFLGSTQAQTTTWTGSSDTDWGNAANWDNGLPGQAFDVIIPPSDNDPIIGIGTTANIKSVTVMEGAALVNNFSLDIDGSTEDAIANSGTLNNNGAIRIGGNTAIGRNAIENRGTFVNNDLLEIGLGAPIGGVGIRNLGTFRNNPSTFGFITIDNTNSHLIDNDGGTIDNRAELYLGLGLGSINGQAISNQAVFNNGPICSATIIVQSDDRIRDNAGGLFTNDGLIQEQTGQSCDISVNNGIVINLGGGNFGIGTNNGTLATSIHTWVGCDNSDWLNNQNWAVGIIPSTTSDVFIGVGPNDAIIAGGADFSLRSLEVSGNAALTVEEGGTLNINNATNDGIRIRPSGSLTNGGTLNIGNTQAIGQHGIDNRGQFENQSSGTVNIDRTVGNGIFNESNDFENSGSLLLGTTGMINSAGINNRNIFRNIGGTIEVEQANTGVYNDSGATFQNADGGILRVGDQVTNQALSNIGIFDNLPCGVVSLSKRFRNGPGGTFNNEGLLSLQTTTSALVHSGSTVMNDGIIEDIFGIIPNNINNNGIWLKPNSSDCTATVQDALQLGNLAGFSVGTTWYADEDFTTPAGTYDPVTNEFQATLEGGTYTLHLAIDENPSACSRVVSIQIDIAEDGEAPVITCPPGLVINANADCEATVPDLTEGAAVTDDCSSMIAVTQSSAAGSFIELGINTLMLTATDEAGNAAGCLVEITVVDDTAPVAGCQDITVELDDTGSVSISPADVELGSTDNCSVTPVSVSPSSFGCDEVGANTVTLMVEDGAGNAHSCTAIVTVEDNNPDADTDGIGDPCDPVFDILIIAENTINYIATLGLDNRSTDALARRLKDVFILYCDGAVNQALNRLNIFINLVNTYVDTGILTASEGVDLIAAAQAIIDAINNGTIECHDENSALIADPGFGDGLSNTVQSSMIVYPNPATRQVTVSLVRTAPSAVLRMVDLQGRTVFEKTLIDGEDRLNVDLQAKGLATGLYLLSLFENGEVRTSRLIVE